MNGQKSLTCSAGCNAWLTTEESDAVKGSRENPIWPAPIRTGSALGLSSTTVAGRRRKPPAVPIARAANHFALVHAVSGTSLCRLVRLTVQAMDDSPVPPCKPASMSRRRKVRRVQIGSFARSASQDGIRFYYNNKGLRGHCRTRPTVCASAERPIYCMHQPLALQDRRFVTRGWAV